MKNLLVILFGVFVSTSALAWNGVVTGQIDTIDVAPGNNYGFRVTLKNRPKLCANQFDWAFLNETDSNYKTFVSVLLAAKASQMSVTLHTNRTGGLDSGYCQIGYLSVR